MSLYAISYQTHFMEIVQCDSFGRGVLSHWCQPQRITVVGCKATYDSAYLVSRGGPVRGRISHNGEKSGVINATPVRRSVGRCVNY